MMLNVYSIYDVAAGVYQRPFYAGADGEATRSFVDLVDERDHPVGKHPSDYSLFRLGRFNDSTGMMLQDEVIECLMTGLQARHIKINDRPGVRDEEWSSNDEK